MTAFSRRCCKLLDPVILWQERQHCPPACPFDGMICDGTQVTEGTSLLLHTLRLRCKNSWGFALEELEIAQDEDLKRATSHARDLTCAKVALSSDPPQPALVNELAADASGTPGRCSLLGPATSLVERLACADLLM